VQHENQKQSWLNEALDLCPLRSHAAEYLQPLLKRCNAKSRKTFWQWLRLTLAKTKDSATFLEWMQESRLKPEVVTPHQREGFRYVINGDVALIEVIDGTDHVVWQVPAAKLEWARNLYPVFLKRLSDLELPETAQRRRLQAQLKRRVPRWTREQHQAVVKQIEELRAMEQRSFAPVPRFMIMKYAYGKEVGVHRLFMDAGPGDIVEPLDGNYTNFTTTTIRRTHEPVAEGGLAIRKGNRPSIESEEVTVPNLYILHSDKSQKNFEDSFLQVKTTKQGDIDDHLPILPNATWRAGCHGQVVDAGAFDPLTPDDPVPVGHVGRKKGG
jgi:hypothetical protein